MQDFSFYFHMGWEHIISSDALDHQLFILALAAIYMLHEWKHVLVLVTAFTIGHSLTLALSVFDIIRFSSAWVEFLIPVTILITALSNLYQKQFSNRSVRINYFLALGFGLIHGMGFANTLRFILASDQNLGWGLFSFNVGLEAGQLAVVIGILLITEIVIGIFRRNRREWVIFLSGGAFLSALFMVLDRIKSL